MRNRFAMRRHGMTKAASRSLVHSKVLSQRRKGAKALRLFPPLRLCQRRRRQERRHLVAVACALALALSTGGCSARPEKTFQFTAASAASPAAPATIEAAVRRERSDPSRRRVDFTPALSYTVTDIVAASAATLSAVFGERPGVLGNDVGAIRYGTDPRTKEQYWYWNLPGSKGRYFVLPIRGEAADVTALIVWIE
jgi:hypothetical protein